MTPNWISFPPEASNFPNPITINIAQIAAFQAGRNDRGEPDISSCIITIGCGHTVVVQVPYAMVFDAITGEWKPGETKHLGGNNKVN